MTNQVFTLSHRVTYAECTVGNHVYYARYLDWLEMGRGEFFRSLGFPMAAWQERDIIFPATECRLKYLGPARYDDVLQIEIWIQHMRRVRLAFGYRVWHGNETVILEATTEHACTTTQDKLTRLPPDLVKALQPYLGTAHDDESKTNDS